MVSTVSSGKNKSSHAKTIYLKMVQRKNKKNEKIPKINFNHAFDYANSYLNISKLCDKNNRIE